MSFIVDIFSQSLHRSKTQQNLRNLITNSSILFNHICYSVCNFTLWNFHLIIEIPYGVVSICTNNQIVALSIIRYWRTNEGVPSQFTITLLSGDSSFQNDLSAWVSYTFCVDNQMNTFPTLHTPCISSFSIFWVWFCCKLSMFLISAFEILIYFDPL